MVILGAPRERTFDEIQVSHICQDGLHNFSLRRDIIYTRAGCRYSRPPVLDSTSILIHCSFSRQASISLCSFCLKYFANTALQIRSCLATFTDTIYRVEYSYNNCPPPLSSVIFTGKPLSRITNSRISFTSLNITACNLFPLDSRPI